MDALRELAEAAFLAFNLPATLLLLLLSLYWLTVIIGALDLSVLDMDLPDVDVDMDGDAGGGVLESMLDYFNVRFVPLSVLLSMFAVGWWVVTMLGNHYLNPRENLVIGTGISLVGVLIGGHVAKLCSSPLVPFFRQMRMHVSDNRDLVGSRVMVTSSKADATFGQAEIRGDGAPITLHVRTDGETISRGTEAVILHYNQEEDFYVISTLEI